MVFYIVRTLCTITFISQNNIIVRIINCIYSSMIRKPSDCKIYFIDIIIDRCT